MAMPLLPSIAPARKQIAGVPFGLLAYWATRGHYTVGGLQQNYVFPSRTMQVQFYLITGGGDSLGVEIGGPVEKDYTLSAIYSTSKMVNSTAYTVLHYVA